MSNSEKSRRSIRKMSRGFCANYRRMRKLAVEDMGMKSFKKENEHLPNESISSSQPEWCKQLRTRFAPGTEDQIPFSDESCSQWNDCIFSSRGQYIPDSIITLIESGTLFPWWFGQECRRAHNKSDFSPTGSENQLSDVQWASFGAWSCAY